MAALISITEPNREAPLVNVDQWDALLRVRFCDAEYDASTFEHVRSQGNVFDPVAKGFPNYQHAMQIRAFLDDLAKQQHITALFVHCHAGQRRSAAVAKYAAEIFNAPFDHAYTGYNKTVYALLIDPTCYGVGKPTRSNWRNAILRLFD